MSADKKEEVTSLDLYVGSKSVASVEDIIKLGREVAVHLATIIEEKKLYTQIGDKKHVHVDGWAMMGAFMGITPVITKTEELEDGSYKAYCELRRLNDGMVIGAGEAICGTKDDGKGRQCWANRPAPHRLSMAETRAVGKAYRTTYGWIIEFADEDYATTPYEEMHGVVVEGEVVQQQSRYDFRVPMCYEHSSDPEDAIPLVWKQGAGEKGEFAFWGCPLYQDEGCRTSSNAPGPDEQDVAEAYWNTIDLALAADTDLTVGIIEKNFLATLFEGEVLTIKELPDDKLNLVNGYWLVVGNRIPLPNDKALENRDGRKALAKGVIKYAMEREIAFDAALKDVAGLVDSGELLFVKKTEEGKRPQLTLVHRENVADE